MVILYDLNSAAFSNKENQPLIVFSEAGRQFRRKIIHSIFTLRECLAGPPFIKASHLKALKIR